MIQEPNSPSITGKGEWRPCPFEEATAFQLNGKVYTAPDAHIVGNYVVFAFDKANERIHKSNLAMFGVQPVKWVEEPLVDIVRPWTWQVSKGRIELIFELPAGFDQSFIESIKGDRFRLTEVLGTDS